MYKLTYVQTSRQLILLRDQRNGQSMKARGQRAYSKVDKMPPFICKGEPRLLPPPQRYPDFSCYHFCINKR